MRKAGFVLALVLLAVSVSASVYTANISDPLAPGRFFPTDAKFEVETLKYDPYPVSPGDSFDVWIKVDNVGQNDAPDAVFSMILSYPFSSKDELKTEYGRVPGVVSATKNQQPGETDIQTNQVILKYRIKVADDAPPGTSSLVLNSYTNGNDGRQYSTKKLPVSIGKTKTDFDIVMQDSGDQGTTFAIANSGENSATAVTFKVKEQQGIVFNGARSSIIGNLASGDFTTVNFQMAPSRDITEVTIQVSYTDMAGIRNTVEKAVPISVARPALGGAQAAQQSSQRSRANFSWAYGLAGFAAGLGLMPVWRRIRRKNETQ